MPPGFKNGPATGVTKAYIKSSFSEYGHDAYEIKGNETYSNMLANYIMPFHLLLTPGWGEKVIFFLS